MNLFKTLFVLFLFVFVSVVSAGEKDVDIDTAYRLSVDELDPDGDFARLLLDYRMSVLETCEPYDCISDGTAEEHIKLTNSEITWFKRMQKVALTLRDVYPKLVPKVICSVHSLLMKPEICQMHHASQDIARLAFLAEKDLASHELVKDLNNDNKQ